MTTIIFTVLITYLIIGIIQVILESIFNENDDAALYFTCFWLIPLIIFINKIYRYIKWKKMKKEG